MALIQTEITAENIADAMAEDPQFAVEVWVDLGHRLRMGTMLDDLADAIRAWPEAARRELCDTYIDAFSTIKPLGD